MVNLSFECNHIIIDFLFLSADLCLECFDVPLLEFEEFGKSRWIHFDIFHHFSQMFRMNSRDIGFVTEVRVLMFKTA